MGAYFQRKTRFFKKSRFARFNWKKEPKLKNNKIKGEVPKRKRAYKELQKRYGEKKVQKMPEGSESLSG